MKNYKTLKIISIVICFLLVSALGVSLGILAHKVDVFNKEMGAVYDAAYYAVLDSLGDTENKLKKVQVASYNKTKKDLLLDVYKNTEVMAVSLARLNNADFETTSLLKFSNQLGGFSHYLAKKLPDEDITEEENDKLITLTEIVTRLEQIFAEAGDNVALGGNLYSSLNEGLTTLDGAYNAFNETDIDYPEMIYDGPFSEGLLDRTPLFLENKEVVSVEEAESILSPIFGAVNHIGDALGGIESYLFEIDNGTVSVSKTGGYIVIIAKDNDDGEITLNQEQAITSASTFLESIGYNDMQAVWIAENNGLAYINYAYMENEIVHYPDLIKVKVDLASGEILGLEAENYIYNHHARPPFSTELQDISNLTFNENFTPLTTRLCLTPTEWNTEILAYEVSGSYGGATYYIYYDAVTLEELKVMRVIRDESQGELIV